jgi:hypothetical protein
MGDSRLWSNVWAGYDRTRVNDHYMTSMLPELLSWAGQHIVLHVDGSFSSLNPIPDILAPYSARIKSLHPKIDRNLLYQWLFSNNRAFVALTTLEIVFFFSDGDILTELAYTDLSLHTLLSESRSLYEITLGGQQEPVLATRTFPPGPCARLTYLSPERHWVPPAMAGNLLSECTSLITWFLAIIYAEPDSAYTKKIIHEHLQTLTVAVASTDSASQFFAPCVFPSLEKLAVHNNNIISPTASVISLFERSGSHLRQFKTDAQIMDIDPEDLNTPSFISHIAL